MWHILCPWPALRLHSCAFLTIVPLPPLYSNLASITLPSLIDIKKNATNSLVKFICQHIEMLKVSLSTCSSLMLPNGTDACEMELTTSRITAGLKTSTGSRWVRSAFPCPSFHRLVALVTPPTSRSIPTQTTSLLKFLAVKTPLSTGEQFKQAALQE